MQFETYSFPSRRSNVVAHNGMVATSQPLAAQAGLDVLKVGGNAVDAAIATAATLCVVEPHSTGIGGDAFALIWSAKESKLYGLNASGPAPQNLTAAYLRNLGHKSFPELGGLPVTVPGSLRGWQMALERFGSMQLDVLLQRPLTYARDGFPLSQRIARAWQENEQKLAEHPNSSRVWLPNLCAPKAGELFKNPEFAHTLQTISTQGVEPFYTGAIGEQIVACVQEAGGRLEMADLASFQAQWVDPISLDYDDQFTFYEIPPNGQGLTALLALSMARQFDLQALGYGTASYYHALIEVMKLAFMDAKKYIADPLHVAVPINGLLDTLYAAQRWRLIQPQNVLQPFPGQPQTHGDTVYLTVADREGNMVSWIQSLYMGFGSGLTAGNTGILLHNRGANFSLEAGHANEVAPGKRPYHTIIPGFITKNSQAWSSFGVMGGFMQPQGHLQVGLNLVEFGMDPQTALDAPRFRWSQNKAVALETAVAPSIHQQLAAWGHEIDATATPNQFGGGQIIVRNPETGVLIGGSEPRNDGTAVGW